MYTDERRPRRQTDLYGLRIQVFRQCIHFYMLARYGTIAKYVVSDEALAKIINSTLNDLGNSFPICDATHHSLKYHVPIFRLNLAKV